MSTSGTGNTATGLSIATVLFIIWAFCSYLVRLWTKYTKTDAWGADDSAFTFSLAAAVFQVTAVLYGVHRGYGGVWAALSKDDLSAVSKTLFAGQILFVLSTGATRVSAAAFSARVLTMDVRQQRFANIFVGLCGLWTIGSMVGVAVRSPVAHPWTVFDGSETMYVRWLPIELTGVFLDFCLLALSISFIWQLQMPTSKRLTVCTIFAVRLATLPVVAARLWSLSPKSNMPAKSPDIAAAVLTEAEMCFALILASATCLKPFLQPFHPGWFVAKSGGAAGITGNHSANTTQKANTYYELSGRNGGGTGSSKEKKQRAITSVISAHDTRADNASDELDLIQLYDKAYMKLDELRPDRVEHRATAFAPATPEPGTRFTSGERPHAVDAQHISKAQAWSVTYD